MTSAVIPNDLANKPIKMTPNAKTVLEKRYLRKGEDGKPVETINEMFWRVAYNVALPDAEYGINVEETARTFYDMLTNFRFLPNSPTFTGAGTPLGGLAACFVVPIKDDLGKEDGGIFDTLRVAALIQQTGGGNGFSFSRLRPKGSLVKASMGQATGPIGFMKVYDSAFGEIAQGGSRRGANMAVLRVDHPDIEEFIRCKAIEGDLSNFNVSVGLTDEFMQAVKADGDFDLRFGGKVYKTVKARVLFDEIVKYAYKNGEPGGLFLDTANRDNPVPHLYELEATNPCVTGDTMVSTPNGWEKIKELAHRHESGEQVKILVDGRFGEDTIQVATKIVATGVKPVWEIQVRDEGTLYNLYATADHRVMTERGWVELQELADTDEIHVNTGWNVRTAKLVSKVYRGLAEVYDLSEPITNSFIANGIVVHNCGEQWLGPYENCCLGSINLAQHINPDGSLNLHSFIATIRTSTRFLDNVVTANKYVPAVPQLKKAAELARRIGLGIMGFSDALYMMGIRYGSDDARYFARCVMSLVRYYSMDESVQLAKERGEFPSIKGSLYDPEASTQWNQLYYIFDHNANEYQLDWDYLAEEIAKYGIRNAAQTTIAPTGTISTVAGIEGYGCEPVFALAYYRWVQDGDKRIQLAYASPLFEQALIKAGVSETMRQVIADKVAITGSCQDVAEVPDEVKRVFVTAGDITPVEHVEMQAAFQRYVDNSISKTINMPPTATPDDVAQAYMLAWQLGCKGITVYVTGSRDKVVLETKQTAQAKTTEGAKSEPIEQPAQQDDHKKQRPRRLVGATHKINTPLGKAYVTINRNGDNEPFEVFATVGKAGSDTFALSEAIGRLTSLVLRLPSAITPTERLRDVVNELGGIGGSRHVGFGAAKVTSLPDAIAKVLRDELAEGDCTSSPESSLQPDEVGNTSLRADICPECGNSTLVREEGCCKCYTCAYSEC